MGNVKRIFVEKKKSFDIDAKNLYRELKYNLGIDALENVRIINRYDVEGITDDEYKACRDVILSEMPVDTVYDEKFELGYKETAFAVEYLPGQYDQRADLIAQCIQLLTGGERPLCRTANIIVLRGNLSNDEVAKVKNYCMNPIEVREASFEKPMSLKQEAECPSDVEVVEGFTTLSSDELIQFIADRGFAMALDDMEFCQAYFRDVEKRDPTITELRMLDTYWSDHCRHTTFLTRIEDIQIEEGKYSQIIEKALESYIKSRKFVYKDQEKNRDISLMDIATINMKELRMKGMLEDLEESDEINASSIVVNVDVDGKNEEWIVMFKNETHNHPTEFEPFGGAATCLGGAIRDPLSGRAYVYQAMRITGSGDPRTPVDKTLSGKLPQRKITTGAAEGYSSYGNQVGVATGQVVEIYDEGYVAKRMELGAVIGAAPKQNVVRGKPEPGDVVILLGGRTGRDGCGGATGSSKEHDEQSLISSGAEVQKGNPPIERRIQALFRKPSVSRLIKKCNDFGAGGVSVAIGELADGIEINLDAVPVKYEGLDGTELAISESQERMAVLVSAEDVERLISAAAEENLEATPVAHVTEEPRVRMKWRGQLIVDISREFLNTSGVRKKTTAVVTAPDETEFFFKTLPQEVSMYEQDIKKAWLNNLERLNICGQKGLVEMFDSTIGAGTVLMPFGGKYQLSPAEGMVAKIPVLSGDTSTGTVMTFGYNPVLSKWSPFHGAVYAIIEAVSKVCAIGGDYRSIRLTLQEYFERLGEEPKRWGKPLAALLGAYYAQTKLGIPSIGGKDSMSGTFNDLDVPPTLVAFAVNTLNVNHVVSTEFKKAGSKVVLIPLNRDDSGLPDFEQLDKNYTKINFAIKSGKVLASCSIKFGGIAEAVSKMCFGNMIGFAFEEIKDLGRLFTPGYGSIILEIPADEDPEELFCGLEYRLLGYTDVKPRICINGISISLQEALESWKRPLEGVFPTRPSIDGDFGQNPVIDTYTGGYRKSGAVRVAKPRVFIPVFPDTNGEYDTAKAFEEAGGAVDVFIMRNLTRKDIKESIETIVQKIKDSQILVLPGGFDGKYGFGAGRFASATFSNPYIKEAVMDLIKNRDGLILGIGSGFQALVKLGLLPYGEFRDITEDSPAITFNTIGRHISRMVYTKVVSNLSPWLSKVKPGDIHAVAVSHGEGRFIAPDNQIWEMIKNGQIATQYVDFDGQPVYDIEFNPNGSLMSIEGITSPDGRILGKMGHSERKGTNVARNIPGCKDQKLFEAGIEYYS